MRDRYYGTTAWKKLRAEVLRRDPVCTTPGCGRASRIADHIMPRARGGADDLDNLRGLCIACHNQRAHAAAEPVARGCLADGRPRDPRHWWNNPLKNLSQLGMPTDVRGYKTVSSAVRPSAARKGPR